MKTSTIGNYYFLCDGFPSGSENQLNFAFDEVREWIEDWIVQMIENCESHSGSESSSHLSDEGGKSDSEFSLSWRF